MTGMVAFVAGSAEGATEPGVAVGRLVSDAAGAAVSEASEPAPRICRLGGRRGLGGGIVCGLSRGGTSQQRDSEEQGGGTDEDPGAGTCD